MVLIYECVLLMNGFDGNAIRRFEFAAPKLADNMGMFDFTLEGDVDSVERIQLTHCNVVIQEIDYDSPTDARFWFQSHIPEFHGTDSNYVQYILNNGVGMSGLLFNHKGIMEHGKTKFVVYTKKDISPRSLRMFVHCIIKTQS